MVPINSRGTWHGSHSRQLSLSRSAASTCIRIYKAAFLQHYESPEFFLVQSGSYIPGTRGFQTIKHTSTQWSLIASVYFDSQSSVGILYTDMAKLTEGLGRSLGSFCKVSLISNAASTAMRSPSRSCKLPAGMP